MKNYKITVNGNVYEVTVEEVNGAAASAPVAPAPKASAPQAPVAPKASVNVAGTKVASPMPGNILDVKVSVGQTVKKGDTILVLEAMKMENDIPALCDGKIVALPVSKGASVQAGETLAVIG